MTSPAIVRVVLGGEDGEGGGVQKRWKYGLKIKIWVLHRFGHCCIENNKKISLLLF